MVSLDGGEVMVTCAVPRTGTATGSGSDRIGVLWATSGVVIVTLALMEGLADRWPLWTWLALALSPLFLDGFWHYERHRTEMGRTVFMPSTFLQKGLH
jgi:hypothetical protein